MAYIFYSGEDPIAKELIGETYGPEKIWFWRQRTTERRPSEQTLRVGVIKRSRVGKEIPDEYLAFRFGAKLNIFRGN